MIRSGLFIIQLDIIIPFPICLLLWLWHNWKILFFFKKKKKINEYYKKAVFKIPGLSILEGPRYSKNNNWLNLVRGKKKLEKKIISK